MLIVMKPGADAQEIDAVVNVIQEIGLRPHSMPGATRTAIGITGNQGPIDGRRFENLPGVAEVIRVTKPYKLITLDLRPEKTVVQVGNATIGGIELAIIAGPRIVNRHLPWHRQCSRAARVSFAAAFGSHGHRLTHSRVWATRRGKLWQTSVRRSV